MVGCVYMSVDWVNIGSGDDEECVLRPVIHYLNQFDQQDHTSVKFELNNKFLKKFRRKYQLQNVGHFVQVSLC